MDIKQIDDAKLRLQNDSLEVGEKLKEAVDNNASNAPYLSIDPQTQAPAVIGNPNEIAKAGADYDLTFMYPEDMLTEEDKKVMTEVPEIGYYQATMHYHNKRVKPLYRGKVISLLTTIMTAVNVIRKDGYTSDLDSEALGKALLEHPEDMAEIARIVLDIPQTHLEYITPKSLSLFITQLIRNEKNILKESHNFLV